MLKSHHQKQKLLNLKNNMKNTLDNPKLWFIYSPRFWAMVIGAVSLYLKAKGIFGDPEMVLITTIMAGFITIKTIDRNTWDSRIAAAKITK